MILADDSDSTEDKWWAAYSFPGVPKGVEADNVSAIFDQVNLADPVSSSQGTAESEQAFLLSVTPRCDASVNVLNIRSTLQLDGLERDSLQAVGYTPFKEQAWIGDQVMSFGIRIQTSCIEFTMDRSV